MSPVPRPIGASDTSASYSDLDPKSTRLSSWQSGWILFASVAAVYVLLFSAPFLWKNVLWLQAMPAKAYPFVDMRGHLAASEAYVNGNLMPGAPVPGDPLGRTHNGPVSMLWLGYLGLRVEHTLIFAPICLLLFLGSVAYTLRLQSLREIFAGWLALTTPASLLLVERGNIDLLVFAVLAVAFGLLAQSGRWPRWLGWGLISGFIGFKYYPALAYAALLELGGTPSVRRAMLGVGAVVVVIYVTANYAELRAVAAAMPGNFLYPQFGASELFRVAGFSPGMATTLGASAWLGGASLLAWGLGPFTAIEAAPAAARLPFAGGGAILAFAFVATVSPDYRVVFFLFCLPWLRMLGRASQPMIRRVAGSAFFLYLLVPWLSMLLGRLAVESRSLDYWWMVMLGKQAGWWALMLCVGALLIRQTAGGVRRLWA